MTDADYKTIAADVRLAAVVLRNKLAAAQHSGLKMDADKRVEEWFTGGPGNIQDLLKFTRTY